MELSEIITPLLCGISPFALGWILLSVIVGIRGGWEATFRLLLLGLELLAFILAIGGLLFYLPDWTAVILMLFVGLLPWLFTLRYFLMSKSSGKLLMTIPSKNEKWSESIVSGAFGVLFGLSNIISHPDFLSITKSHALGLCLISLGVSRIVQRIRYSQIREAGILYESGSLYKWDNIEGYRWKFGEDKLSLQLRNALFKKNVELKILSQFRQEAVNYLSQHRDERSNTNEYIPIQKAG